MWHSLLDLLHFVWTLAYQFEFPHDDSAVAWWHAYRHAYSIAAWFVLGIPDLS